MELEKDITKYDKHIRNKVAKNLDTREEILDILSQDEEELVRKNVVKNPNTSFETLKYIVMNLDDTKDSSYIKESLIKNEKITIELLEKISTKNLNPYYLHIKKDLKNRINELKNIEDELNSFNFDR